MTLAATSDKRGALAYLSRKQMYEKMRGLMETERSSFITRWQSLNKYITPTRGRFWTTDGNRGDRTNNDILDSSGTIAMRTLASGMMSGITSPAREWFRLTTPDPDLAEHGSVKEWLFQVTERMRWVLSRTNFYNKASTMYQDLGTYGTAGMMQLEDDHKVARFADLPVGSFCVANNENDEPNTLCRAYRMTVRQLVKKFGLHNCTRAVQQHWANGNIDSWIDVVHFVEPNEDYDAESALDYRGKKIISVYYEIGSPTRGRDGRDGDTPELLSVGGFDEFPAMIPVWEVTGEDVYGTNCPGMLVLPDVKGLQKMEKRSLQGVEKMVNPPMTGPTALRSVRVSTLPSDITYVDVREGQQGFRAAHEVRLDVEKLEMKMAQCRQRIDRGCFADLFLMLSYMDQARPGKQPVTAAEIYERHEEKLLALGPVLEQLNQRFLDPTIDRLYKIMERRGFIPPPPPDLHGVTLRVEYISTMHQAQKANRLGGLRSLPDLILPIAQVDPSIMDKWNTDKWIEHVNDAAGNAPDVIVPQDQVDKVRQARAQAQQQAQQAEQLKTSADAAKNLSQADTSGKNALTDMASSGIAGLLGAGSDVSGGGNV